MNRCQTTKYRKQRKKEKANRKSKLAIYTTHAEPNKVSTNKDKLADLMIDDKSMSLARKAFQNV